MSYLSSHTPEMEAKKAVAWAEAQRKSQFCYADLAAVAHTEERRVRFWCDAWLAEGKVRLIGDRTGARNRKRFEVLPEGEIIRPQAGDAFDQMWFTMRKSPQGFSPVDLQAQASVEIPLEAARSYCHTLLAARYLTVVRKAASGRSEAIYRLTNQTGVNPPRLRRLSCLVDPNSQKIIPMVEARHG